MWRLNKYFWEFQLWSEKSKPLRRTVITSCITHTALYIYNSGNLCSYRHLTHQLHHVHFAQSIIPGICVCVCVSPTSSTALALSVNSRNLSVSLRHLNHRLHHRYCALVICWWSIFVSQNKCTSFEGWMVLIFSNVTLFRITPPKIWSVCILSYEQILPFHSLDVSTHTTYLMMGGLV